MTTLVVQAAWALVAAFLLSLVYEIYRATAKAGTSRHDSVDAFVKNNVALYVVAALVIGLLFVGFEWAPVIGLVFSVAVIGASILFYNPRIMLDRQPGIVDWFEDIRLHRPRVRGCSIAALSGPGGHPRTLRRCLPAEPPGRR